MSKTCTRLSKILSRSSSNDIISGDVLLLNIVKCNSTSLSNKRNVKLFTTFTKGHRSRPQHLVQQTIFSCWRYCHVSFDSQIRF